MSNLRKHDPMEADNYDSSSDELETQERKPLPSRGWSAHSMTKPASGILGKGQTPAPRNEQFSRWDANQDDGVD